MSRLKLQTMALAGYDFFSDGIYVSFSEFASFPLQAASLLAFILPTVAFCVISRATVAVLLKSTWAFYVRKVTGGESSWEEFDSISTFGIFVVAVLRAAVWGVPILFFGPVLLILAINAKLFAFPTLAAAINDAAGAAGGDDAAITVTAVNLSLVLELLLESLPEFFLMLANEKALGQGYTTVFYLAAAGSVLDILNGVWPIVFWMRKKRSFMGGLGVELFDKWTCPACAQEMDATIMRCKKEGCGGRHPELLKKPSGAMRTVSNPFDSPAARTADDGFAASNPMHVGAQGLVPSNQDGAMESLKERTLRIYNETPDTMRQTNLSLGTEDGDEEESAVV